MLRKCSVCRPDRRRVAHPKLPTMQSVSKRNCNFLTVWVVALCFYKDLPRPSYFCQDKAFASWQLAAMSDLPRVPSPCDLTRLTWSTPGYNTDPCNTPRPGSSHVRRGAPAGSPAAGSRSRGAGAGEAPHPASGVQGGRHGCEY